MPRCIRDNRGMDDARELLSLLRAGHPIISITTHDEDDARRVVEQALAEYQPPRVYQWSALSGITEGLISNPRPVAETENAGAALFWASRLPDPFVLVSFDLLDHMEDPLILRGFRELRATLGRTGSTLVMIDHKSDMPDAVRAHATPMQLDLPKDEQVEAIIRETLQTVHRTSPLEINLTRGEFRMMVKNLAGLRPSQIRQIVRDVVCDDAMLDASDLNTVLARKRQMVSGGGVLDSVESPASLDDVGGLNNLKAWLAVRERSFEPDAVEFGIKPPRGVLLLGVQGAGKSLCAKAIATAWQRPLLRLDAGKLYDKFVGESERNLRSALTQAEAMAPVVLWIDEIEKAFASAGQNSNDGGLSQRMFGQLLTWMNDHDQPVFLVATANNINALPPELLRKGRFDEIFFVDLPKDDARRLILAIHLRKRGRKPEQFDIARLAAETEGYSGAELEQGVVSALHTAFNERREPTTDDISAALAASPPLSVTMREGVERLRAWARGRCVPAD